MASGLQAVSGEVAQLGTHLHGLPPLPDRVVPRPRVEDAIAERIERYPLVQVIAPAGSGKTTAVVQAVERLDRPVTWLTIEDWHRSATRLLDSLIEALERIAPGLTNQVTRARAEDTDTVELAAIASSFVRRHDAVLVVDDCHLLLDSPESVSVLSALVRRGGSGLHVVLLGRALVPLVGVGVDALAPDATVGDDLLRAERKEAEEILLEHGATVDVDEAVEATGGWLAGLLFESWGSREGGAPSLDPLGEYLEREIRPRLGHDAYDQLVASSIFDDVDAARAEAIGAEDPRAWLASLRLAGVPATWAPNGQHMRLHPRVRELLRAALAMGPGERRRTVERTAAETYEHEGRLEDALELYLDLGETARADVLLPAVLPGVVERHDVPLAERLLGSTRLDPEPARITLARLTLASLKLEGRDALTTLNRLEAEGRLDEAVAEEPAIGALGCNFLLANGEINRAADLQSRMPGGRAADVARLLLSAVRDDPRAPVPAFQGDVLDAVLARALYHRGLLRELRTGRTSWSETSGTHDLDTQTAPDGRETPKRFTTTLARFARAISERNLEDARRCVSALEGVPFYQRLAEVELAVRLERDPGHARAALEALSEDRVSAAVFYAEVLDAWDGAVRLLEDDPAGAAAVLREAVASMRRGDRILALPNALVYLAEAEWRLGEEESSDRATDEAYEVARRQGSLRELLLALADVPGVLSRRIDAEPAGDSRWHALGRTLVGGSHASPRIVAASAGAHLREFGEPGLVVHGCDVRPKIRKSLELLSYLLLAPTACVSREDVLNALWNGRDDDSTRAYLRQALRHLRDVLPDGISVTAVSDSLSIEGAVTSESLELEALLAEAARDAGPGRLGYLLEALELGGRGLFLEGSSDVRWVDDHRSRIESVLADARLDAAELLLEAERHLRALTLVDEALDADPLLERAWRLRMRTLDLLGDNDGVTAAYAACARALAEIGLEPSGQTRELARTLRS